MGVTQYIGEQPSFGVAAYIDVSEAECCQRPAEFILAHELAQCFGLFRFGFSGQQKVVVADDTQFAVFTAAGDEWIEVFVVILKRFAEKSGQ